MRVADVPTLAQAYTADELAACLRCKPRKINMMALRGDIKPAYKIGGDWRFPPRCQIRDEHTAAFFTMDLFQAQP